jgi:hypothetical protein
VLNGELDQSFQIAVFDGSGALPGWSLDELLTIASLTPATTMFFA